MAGLIEHDTSRFARVEARYAQGRMKVLTAATEMTQVAMDEGEKRAKANIQHLVYDAYTPHTYIRQYKLLNSVKKRRGKEGAASGSIFVSAAVLNENRYNTRHIYYAAPVDQRIGMNAINPTGTPGPRPFWRATLAEMRGLYFGTIGPAAGRQIKNAFKKGA